MPLPLDAIYNKRSLVTLDNLVDLIVTCIDHPAVANETFLVSDDEDLSTTENLLLGWAPPVTVDEALRKTARDFQERLQQEGARASAVRD